MPFSDAKYPALHSVIGVYGTIGIYMGCHCIEADGIKTIVGGEYSISDNEESIYSAYVISAVESPVDLHIYYSLGNHTGAVYDEQDNVIKTELGIPNSIYLGPDSHPELILITDPKTGPYRQELKGTEKGNYTLTTIAVDRNGGEVYRIQRKDRPIEKDETDIIAIPVILNEGGEITINSLPTDVNNDGSVDILDVIQIARRYGTRRADMGYDEKYDLNGDDAIDFSDLMMVGQDFGVTSF